MTDTQQEQEALLIFRQEIKTILNGVQASLHFNLLMTILFQDGFTAKQAFEKFFENQDKEFKEYYMQLNNTQ